jgi:tetratricopeptide (TPR) repeat protein
MTKEFLQMLHEEEKMNYVSKNTHIDIRDLYQDYLDNDAKQLRPKSDKRLISWGSDGIIVVNIADVWISLYTKAIGINPNDAEIYYKRASYYEIRGKQDEAIADYSEAINMNPDYIDAYLRRSQCYKKMRLKDEAISDYNNVIRLNSDYESSAVLYGFVTKTFAVDIL